MELSWTSLARASRSEDDPRTGYGLARLVDERPGRLVHQPSGPVRILFVDHLHFGTPAPASPVIVPLNLVFGDFAEDTRADQVAYGNLIRFAAVLSANLHDEIPDKDSIARRLDLFENIAHGLLAIGVFAGLGRHLQKR